MKHFKFELRGKRRMHKKPVDAEIAACHDWLKREIELVAPRLIVAMGATAVRSVLGRAAPIMASRGKVTEYASGIALLITVHPSFLLRVPEQDKDDEYGRFLDDIKLANPLCGELSTGISSIRISLDCLYVYVPNMSTCSVG